jgi:hypothetical protein
MNEANPYAPPRTPVADPVIAEQIGPCPHVERACQLLWISFAISVIARLISVFTLTSGIASVAGLVGLSIGTVFAGLLLWWVTRKLRQGRNWMRWLYTIANVLITALSLFSIAGLVDATREMMLSMWREYPLLGVSSLAQLAFGVAALVLLHTATSREWFRAKSQSA